MTDESFLQAILEDPSDDNFRLIAADWLEEHGDGARSEFIRVQCELRTMPRESGGAPVDDDRWTFLRSRERELLALRATDVFGNSHAFPLWWQWTNGMPAYICVSKTTDLSSLVFRRGFVAQVTLPTQAFLDHAADLFRAAPIEDVRLSDSSWRIGNNRFEMDLPLFFWSVLSYGMVIGESAEFVLAEHSCACVQYGRKLAGLPPLTRAAHG